MEQLSKLRADALANEQLKQRLREHPLTVFKEYGIPMSTEARELSKEEVDRVTGGLSLNMIDARGGSIRFGDICIVTYDINGDISSVSPLPK